MKYEEPQMKVVMLPEAMVFTLTSDEGGGGTVETQPDNGANSWLQSW